MFYDSDVVWEFFSPFAHIPGKYEACRIHSPTHGSFDTFIVLGASTALPPVVYVNSDSGTRFMADRYPESACIQVARRNLSIVQENDGAVVAASLTAGTGPLCSARLRFSVNPESIPKSVPYGGPDFAVWGSRWACEGIDLIREGTCTGTLVLEDGASFSVKDEPCVVTAGSIARITTSAGRSRTR